MDNLMYTEILKPEPGGEIYIGVVGPVRTGKSTFIKRFMELLVLPAMEDEHLRAISRDELPRALRENHYDNGTQIYPKGGGEKFPWTTGLKPECA